MGRQRLQTRVLLELYDALVEITEALPVKAQTEVVKNVVDIAERMSIEDIQVLTETFKALITARMVR